MKSALILIVLGVALAGAQTIDSNTITVTATRTTNVPAESVQYTLTANSPSNVDAATVQAALAKAGITGLTFGGTNSPTLSGIITAGLSWTFSGTVAYAKLNDQLKLLTTAADTLRAGSPSIILSYSLSSSAISDATAQDVQRKLLPDAVADARKRAVALADAAGIKVGNLIAVSDATVTSGTPYYAARISATVDVTASITVKFAALRYN